MYSPIRWAISPRCGASNKSRNDACYHLAPESRIVTVGGGMSYGAVGPTHHATEDLAILRALPETTVICPGDHWEVKQATRDIVDLPGVTYFFVLDKSAVAPVSTREDEVFVLGKARKIVDGSAATLIATGGILGEAVKAAAILRSRGIEVRVLSCHTVKPLDEEAILDAALQTGGIVTVEEHALWRAAWAAPWLKRCSKPAEDRDSSPRIGLRSGFSSIVGSTTVFANRIWFGCRVHR